MVVGCLLILSALNRTRVGNPEDAVCESLLPARNWKITCCLKEKGERCRASSITDRAVD